MTFKSTWLSSHLRCPACLSSHFSADARTCKECGETRPEVDGVPNFITDELAIDCRVVKTDNVSAHPYAPSVLQVLDEVAANGGMALDCGAGYRTYCSEHLVQTEIAAYPNVDVLAVNQ